MNEPTKHIALFTASQCLAHDAMLAFLEQRLTKNDQNTVLAHLDACELCKDAMEGLSSIKPQNIQRSVAYLQKTLHQKAQEHQKANKHKESRQLKRNFPWMSVAASIILFLGVFYYFKFYLIKQSDQNKLVSSENIMPSANNPSNLDTAPKQLLAVGGIKAEPQVAERQAQATAQPKFPKSVTLPEEVVIAANDLEIMDNDLSVNAYAPIESSKQTSVEETKAEESVFMVVETMPEFPGGERALLNYIANNLQFPDSIELTTLKTTAYVKFTVDTAGKPSKPQIMKSIDVRFDKQLIKLIEHMPNWKPAQQRGKKVAVQMVLPIKIEPHK
jgi:hypothetical protein